MSLLRSFLTMIVLRRHVQNRLNIPEMNGRYFNAGVIYVNLKKWHEANLTPYLLKLLRGETKYGSLKYLDQDALNIAFNMNNIYLAKVLILFIP